MMCKVFVLATAALVAGFLVVSDARSVMSKFKYSGNAIDDHIVVGLFENFTEDTVDVTLTHGVMKGFNHVKSVSDWVPMFGDGYATASYNYSFPNLIFEINTIITENEKSTHNRLVFNFVESKFDLRSNGTRNAEGKCELEFSVTLEPRLSLDRKTDIYLAKILERLPHLKERLMSDVLRSVENTVAVLAPLFVKQKIEATISLDAVCRNLQEQNFQPLVGLF